MPQQVFHDFDFTDFWDDNEYSLREYVSEPPTDELIKSIEAELGYKLPPAYIELMKLHNGGTPRKNCFPTTTPTSWAQDHIAITGIFGIGREKAYSLCGHSGSRFMIEEWEYPATGIYICDCPSAGHDMILLDYSKCGAQGEPEVVHIDQESDYKKTFLATDFETFIRGLVSEAAYDTSAQDLAASLETLRTGAFSSLLQAFFKKETAVDFDRVLRNLLTQLTTEKGYFALHADARSHLAYDVQFYLLSKHKTIKTKKAFLTDYPGLIAFGDKAISTGGYAPDFVDDWFDEKVKRNEIAKDASGHFKFSKAYEAGFLERLKPYE